MALDPSYVKDLSRKLRKSLKKSGGSLSPGRVHKLRTYIRRVEAAADAALPQPNRRDKRVLKSARRIRKQAGKVRDMDVLTADALAIPIRGKQKEELVPLLEYLGSQRFEEAARLCSLVRKEGPKLRKKMKRFSSHLKRYIRNQESVNGSNSSPEVLARTVSLLSDLKNPSRLTPANLHPYRLKVKELRDVVRLSSDANHSKLVSSLGEVKDAIGDWHDWQELTSLADEILDEPNGAVSKALKHTVEQKYAHALSLAERMRRDFLDSKKSAFGLSIVRTTAAMAKR